MTIDYAQLKTLVKEAMFTGGGINEPSAPEGIPHRMPAAATTNKEQDMGDPDTNKKYEIALVAREAAEILVETLDEPIYDSAYEHAFKASASLRRVLNELISVGAHPMPTQRVVAPPRKMQKYTAGSYAADYMGATGGVDGIGMQESLPAGIGPQASRAVEMLQKITDPDEIMAIMNFLIASPQFPGITGDGTK